MGFNSQTARDAGKKSRRGKGKYSGELREKLQNLFGELLKTIDPKTLNNTERIALLRILAVHSLPKLKDNIEQENLVIEILDGKTRSSTKHIQKGFND